MYINDIETKQLTAIIAKNGLSHRGAGQLVGYFKHLELHRGIKFLVAVLKDMKNHILRGTPIPYRGQAKYIRRLASSGKRRHKTMALRICNLYGRWEAKPAKEKDYRLFAKTVAQEPVIRNIKLELTVQQVDLFRECMGFARFSFAPLSSNSTHILADNRSCKGSQATIDQEMIALTESGWIYMEFRDYIHHVFSIPKSAHQILRCMAEARMKDKTSRVGRVVCLTKDRGLKYRFIANLMKGWQVAISPSMFVYKEFLRRQEMSALNDQVGAVYWMISELQNGKKITSVDLKQATDFLPRYLLEDVLTSILPLVNCENRSSNFIQAFLLDNALCRSSYWTPFENIDVTYNTGQAMGRWTSKYQLDLVMFLLAQHVGANGSNCRINGDDIVFSDTKVGTRFIKLLKYLCVPISTPKTFIHKDFGEFSGKIADVFGIVRAQKESPSDVKRDPLGPLRKYGPRGISLVPKKLRNAIWAIASLPEPYGLPEIRKASGNPYMGFQPVVRPKRFERITWDPKWVDQAFLPHSLRLQERRLSRLTKHMSREGISEPDKKSLDVLASSLWIRINQLREQMFFYRTTQQHFSTPLQRIDLLADNFKSYSIKTSDGWKLVGFGDPAFDELYAKATKRFSHSSTKPDDVTWERKPTMPIQWVRKVYKQICAWVARYN